MEKLANSQYREDIDYEYFMNIKWNDSNTLRKLYNSCIGLTGTEKYFYKNLTELVNSKLMHRDKNNFWLTKIEKKDGIIDCTTFPIGKESRILNDSTKYLIKIDKDKVDELVGDLLGANEFGINSVVGVIFDNEIYFDEQIYLLKLLNQYNNNIVGKKDYRWFGLIEVPISNEFIDEIKCNVLHYSILKDSTIRSLSIINTSYLIKINNCRIKFMHIELRENNINVITFQCNIDRVEVDLRKAKDEDSIDFFFFYR